MTEWVFASFPQSSSGKCRGSPFKHSQIVSVRGTKPCHARLGSFMIFLFAWITFGMGSRLEKNVRSISRALAPPLPMCSSFVLKWLYLWMGDGLSFSLLGLVAVAWVRQYQGKSVAAFMWNETCWDLIQRETSLFLCHHRSLASYLFWPSLCRGRGESICW